MADPDRIADDVAPKQDVGNAAPEPQRTARLTGAARPAFVPPPPAFRKLRGYAVDPSLTTTSNGRDQRGHVQAPRKAGSGADRRYLEVMDLDPRQVVYAPVDLTIPCCWHRMACRWLKASLSFTSRWSIRSV